MKSSSVTRAPALNALIRKFPVVRLTALILAVSCSADLAAQGDAGAFLRRGNEAFRAGDYEQALVEYSDALANGDDRPIIFFNMGSSHYRLGQYSQAASAFTEAARDNALAGVSYFNLGLISEQQGDQTQAREWFVRSRESATDQRLVDLADNAIDSLDSGGFIRAARSAAASDSVDEAGFALTISARVAFDDNPFRSPDNSYVDISQTGAPIVSPVSGSGFYIPLRISGEYSHLGASGGRLFGGYSLSSNTYIDSALSSADRSVQRIFAGLERRMDTGRGTHDLNLSGVMRQHDETNFDRDDGLERLSGSGASIADRYDYRSMGLEAELEGELDRLEYSFGLRIEDRNYDDTVVVSQYDHDYSRFSASVGFDVASRSGISVEYVTQVRDYSERRARDLLGNFSAGNPSLEYEYEDLGLTFSHGFSSTFRAQVRYVRSERTDKFVGYNSYSEDSIRLVLRRRIGSGLIGSLVASYRDRSYPNAFAFDEVGQPAKAYDEFQFRLLADYELSPQLGLNAELRTEDVNSSDPRGEYGRTRLVFGVTWVCCESD